MTCSLRQSTYHNIPSLILSNDLVQLTLVPELGGKISSFIHLASQREWLWQNPHLPIRPVSYDASFTELYDTGGFDECFPAVGPGPYPDEPWQGAMIPDHGELWCQAWEVVAQSVSDDEISVTLVCHGVRFPYRFERTVTMRAGSATITLDYNVTNFTSFEMPFVWSSHPLLAIEEGMRVVLPAGTQTIRLESDSADLLGNAGDLLSWPRATTVAGAPFDLAQVPNHTFGRAYKLYTPPLTQPGKVTTKVENEAGDEAISLTFDTHEINQIGIWMNYGGWCGTGSTSYFNLGLEPCIGGHDVLSNAKNIGEYGTLPARQSKQWSLQMALQ